MWWFRWLLPKSWTSKDSYDPSALTELSPAIWKMKIRSNQKWRRQETSFHISRTYQVAPTELATSSWERASVSWQRIMWIFAAEVSTNCHHLVNESSLNLESNRDWFSKYVHAWLIEKTQKFPITKTTQNFDYTHYTFYSLVHPSLLSNLKL